MTRFLDPAAAPVRYLVERDCPVAAAVSHVPLVASGQVAAPIDNDGGEKPRPADRRRLRLIVAAFGLSLLVWIAIIAVILRAGIGLHVLACVFFLIVGVIAGASIANDLRRAALRMRERGL